MNPDKNKLLNDTYNTFMDLMLGDLPLDSINDLAVEDVTGYGSTADEKIYDINRLRQLVIDQREQGAGVEISVDTKPVHRRISPEEDTAIFIDEIVVTILDSTEKNVLNLRLSIIFEFINEGWKVVHMHGSTGVETDGDTWHIDEWKKKTEDLQKMVDEKTAELQKKNHELEIETALERVRAVALGMNKPDDLLNICEILFGEFQSLGFKELRNAMINIHNDEKRSFLDYDYSDVMGKSVTQLNYDTHPVMERQIKQSGIKNDAFSEAIYKDKDLDEWKKFRKESGEKDDPRIEHIEALYYYFYSIGNGTIGISTLSPIGEEKLTLLKRFRNVFSLAYQRYSDIALAEAQAREAQIEAALERVRAKAMSMQKSEDLSGAVKIVFDELDKLNLGMIRCGIGILNKEKRTADVYTTTISEDKNTMQVSGDESMDIHPLLQGAFDAWMNGTDFSYVLEGDDLTSYYKSLLGVNFKLPESQSKTAASEGLKQYYYVTSFQAGGLFAFRESPFPEESKIVMKRFADVFNLTYTRFNDLLQAEAQNKIIQADNERKTKELEDARELQLAMLPKEIPQFPGLDIKVFMQTATEVGGDYYDFSSHANGSFNIAIGDATGHGMKAGTLVTMMKSLFVANSGGKDIEGFFASTNAAIKNSNLKRMMAGFAMLNISGHKARYINAGMPSVYHYVKNKKEIEEIKQHNLPLGAMKIEKYNATEINLNKGDVLLLMTDGFPELQNPEGELLGYEKVLSTFGKVADNEPEEIIKYLNDEGKRWKKNKELLDDVTFVVIKVK